MSKKPKSDDKKAAGEPVAPHDGAKLADETPAPAASTKSQLPKVDMKLLRAKSPKITNIKTYMRYWKDQIGCLRKEVAADRMSVADFSALVGPLRDEYRKGADRMSQPVPSPVVVDKGLKTEV